MDDCGCGKKADKLIKDEVKAATAPTAKQHEKRKEDVEAAFNDKKATQTTKK